MTSQSIPPIVFDQISADKVEHNYHDHANDGDLQECLPVAGLLHYHLFPNLTGGRGTEPPFPVKLHSMLEHVENAGMDSIVSWQPHGRCFVVHQQEEFVKHILKSWFRQTKFPSFQRQLNLYGFKRISKGRDRGAYYHEMFLRMRPLLSFRIHRLKIKGTGVRKASSPDTEPNFHNMPFLPHGPLDMPIGIPKAPALKAPVHVKDPPPHTTDAKSLKVAPLERRLLPVTLADVCSTYLWRDSSVSHHFGERKEVAVAQDPVPVFSDFEPRPLVDKLMQEPPTQSSPKQHSISSTGILPLQTMIGVLPRPTVLTPVAQQTKVEHEQFFTLEREAGPQDDNPEFVQMRDSLMKVPNMETLLYSPITMTTDSMFLTEV